MNFVPRKRNVVGTPSPIEDSRLDQRGLPSVLRLGRQRLGQEPCIDRSALESDELQREFHVRQVDVLLRHAVLREDLREKVFGDVTRRVDRHFQAFQILAALDLAAVPQLLAGERLRRHQMALYPEHRRDAHIEALMRGIEEAGRRGAHAAVEPAGRHRRDRIEGASNVAGFNLDAFLGEIALAHRDIERRLACAFDELNIDRLFRLGRRNRRAREQAQRRHGDHPPLQHTSPPYVRSRGSRAMFYAVSWH